ncbi:LysR family transcriptional regulator [Rhodovulum viride]|uniref:LysR family transcriptional regulator n=1 Tax=Rhodovulum viride TaxID=1231134 RepID=A0ABX9DKE7_9RHOB|nr:LysR family transcriptional regulator [Rhodovulum viride]RAP41737.1 LysR family transcriptional regulator [Rhodovulum viride]
MKLDRLPFFAAVVETGSFTRAADRLGVTKAVVSAHVARLEEELGTALLVRTTRRVTATAEGLLLHEKCQVILQEASEAEEALLHAADRPTGLLRITAPLDFGQSVLVPLVAEFRRRYPDCRVELDLTDAVVDLQSGRWDLSVRLGWLVDSSLKSRRVGRFGQALVAAPAFLDDFGPIETPADLKGLPFVANSALHDPGSWDFEDGSGQVERVRFDTVVSMSTTAAVLAGALHGMGCAVLPDFLLESPLRDGQLQPLLSGWSLRDGGIHIVYPPTRYRQPKVTAFAEMLIRAQTRTT